MIVEKWNKNQKDKEKGKRKDTEKKMERNVFTQPLHHRLDVKQSQFLSGVSKK